MKHGCLQYDSQTRLFFHNSKNSYHKVFIVYGSTVSGQYYLSVAMHLRKVIVSVKSEHQK